MNKEILIHNLLAKRFLNTDGIKQQPKLPTFLTLYSMIFLLLYLMVYVVFNIFTDENFREFVFHNISLSVIVFSLLIYLFCQFVLLMHTHSITVSHFFLKKHLPLIKNNTFLLDVFKNPQYIENKKEKYIIPSLSLSVVDYSDIFHDFSTKKEQEELIKLFLSRGLSKKQINDTLVNYLTRYKLSDLTIKVSNLIDLFFIFEEIEKENNECQEKRKNAIIDIVGNMIKKSD